MNKTADIRSVRNAEDLIGYFAAKLGWNIDVDSFDSLDDADYQEVTPAAPMYFCVPRNTEGEEEYRQGFSKGRALSAAAVAHYRQIIHALLETDRLMRALSALSESWMQARQDH